MKRESIFSCPTNKFSHPFSVSTPSQPCHSWHDLLSSKILLNYSVHSGWIQITVLIFKSLFLPKASPSFIVSVFLSWLTPLLHSTIFLPCRPSLFSCQHPYLSECKTVVSKKKLSPCSSSEAQLLNLLWALMNSCYTSYSLDFVLSFCGHHGGVWKCTKCEWHE